MDVASNRTHFKLREFPHNIRGSSSFSSISRRKHFVACIFQHGKQQKILENRISRCAGKQRTEPRHPAGPRYGKLSEKRFLRGTRDTLIYSKWIFRRTCIAEARSLTRNPLLLGVPRCNVLLFIQRIFSSTCHCRQQNAENNQTRIVTFRILSFQMIYSHR